MSENQIIIEGSLPLASYWLRKCFFRAVFMCSHVMVLLPEDLNLVS